VTRPFWLNRFLIQSGIARFLPVTRRLTDGGEAYVRYFSDKVLAAPAEELLDSAYFPSPGPDAIDLNLPAPRGDSALSAGRLTVDRRGTPPAWGTSELRGAVADFHLRRDGRLLDPERQIFVTNGATAGYGAALDAFINPGERVVLLNPCSPLFSLGAASRRADVHWVPTWSEEGQCRYVRRVFERAMRRAKMLVLADPANPTGAVFGPEELEHLAWMAARYGVIVYLDESFARFRYDGLGRLLATMPGADRYVLTAGSMSQGWGLGSARVGWLAGPGPLVRVCALTACLNAPYVPTVCQQVAARALAESDGDFAPILDQFRGRRHYAIDRLRALDLEPEWPAGGYFVWLPVAPLGIDGRTFAERLFRDFNVLVGPGNVYGPGGSGHIRLSFAADDGRLREGLARLARFVYELRGTSAVEENITEQTPVEAETAADEESRPVFSRA
jgi:aspartate/methionine/tyrosine aminotransferase